MLYAMPFSLLIACTPQKETSTAESLAAQQIMDQVKSEYAPDSRVALFDLTVRPKAHGVLLSGESNLKAATATLKAQLTAAGIAYEDSIRLLPDAAGLEHQTMGVIKISVANLREKPAHSSQLVTQALMGTPVYVYKKEENWYYIQTPDGYLAWVDQGGIQNMSPDEFASWKAQEKLIFLNPFGQSFKTTDETHGVVSDLVAGNVLTLTGKKGKFYAITYPDGRTGYVPDTDAMPYQQWLENTTPDGHDLVTTGEQLMGLPYLWGGTSPKGVDCSGFTKTVFFLNGIIIPRDASQQVHTGILVDSVRNFENLMAGDLLFFGRPATDSTKERVIHVGMWIGDQHFIHSMGDVHISNMDTTAEDFDAYNYNRYLRTKRILHEKGPGLQYLNEQPVFIN